MSTDAFDDDDARFFCPTLARAFALFVLATTTSPREPPRRFHCALVVHSESDDRGARATKTTRATMSRPDRWTRGVDDAFEAYGVDGRAAATLDVRASSDRWVRFERRFREKTWTTTTTRDGPMDAAADAFGARMTIVFANVDGAFVRRASRSFVEGARAGKTRNGAW